MRRNSDAMIVLVLLLLLRASNSLPPSLRYFSVHFQMKTRRKRVGKSVHRFDRPLDAASYSSYICSMKN